MASAVSQGCVQRAGGDLTAMRWDGAKLHYEVTRTSAPPGDTIYFPDAAATGLAMLQASCDGSAAISLARDPATGTAEVRCGASGPHAVDASP
jgi:hypothetical protein